MLCDAIECYWNWFSFLKTIYIFSPNHLMPSSCVRPMRNRVSISPRCSLSGILSRDTFSRSFYAFYSNLTILFLVFLSFSFRTFPKPSHHSPFPVPLSLHTQNISKLPVSPLILAPSWVDVFEHPYIYLSDCIIGRGCSTCYAGQVYGVTQGRAVDGRRRHTSSGALFTCGWCHVKSTLALSDSFEIWHSCRNCLDNK